MIEKEKSDSIKDLPNKKSKKSYLPKEIVQEHLKYFQTKYPACFTTPPSPLAINIHLELRKCENKVMSNNLINRLLAAYTSSKEYKQALKIGAHRLDLQGNIVSEVNLNNK